MATQSTKTGKACPTCGAERESWDKPDGYDGVHCCESCAEEDTGKSSGSGSSSGSSSGKQGGKGAGGSSGGRSS